MARDHYGRTICWSIKVLPSISDPLVPEAWACREVVLLVKDRGFNRVWVEGNSISVIQAIKNRNPPPEISVLIEEICSMVSCFLLKYSLCLLKDLVKRQLIVYLLNPGLIFSLLAILHLVYLID